MLCHAESVNGLLCLGMVLRSIEGVISLLLISMLLLIFLFNCYLLTYFVYLNPQKIAKKDSLRVRFIVLFRILVRTK